MSHKYFSNIEYKNQKQEMQIILVMRHDTCDASVS